MIYLDEKEFTERVYDIAAGSDFKGLVPAVVSFHTLTTYCQKMNAIIDDVAALHTDINFYGIDVDTENEFVTKLGIRAIPAMIIIPLTGKPAIIAGLFYTHDDLEKALTKVIFPSRIIKV